MQHQDSHLFLTEPAQISELNDWIVEYQNSQQRFTFTEAEILQACWDQGEDILLREDSRFKEAALPDLPFPGQWQLSTHTIANQLIYDSLLHNEWDGEDLSYYLQQLDQQNTEATFHIFCRTDKRISLSPDEGGCYHIILNQMIVKVSLSSEQKKDLDGLACQLLEAFPHQNRAPWATFEILEQIKHISSNFPTLEPLIPTELAHWLSRRDEWAKVGRDLWFPKHLLPPPVQNRRYAVLSVDAGKRGQMPSFLEPVDTDEQDMSEVINQEISYDKQTQDPQQTVSRNRWKVVLRTLHLNEGYIPVLPRMRVFYPYGQKLSNLSVLPGIWFADASEMTVWLDMTHHRLYGPDVTDHLAFLDAGTILEIFWSNAGFTFSLAGQDPEIFEEEARLIDLTELAHLRSTLLESYRTSLRVILASANQGKVFAELYLELYQRQQHKPNRSTIRGILSSSPEFFFDKSERKWRLSLNISNETGASALRKVAVAAQQIASKNGHQSPDTLSLTTMIASNRQQLIDLRKFYSHKDHSNA
jgi:hypothetical protein